ncbi:hypothetical protein AMJ80_05945 [bacterium SM23_31]|nr:MAG: hypothetical protein AMJ80_05945 [bacterium SM23_31]
MESSPIHYNIVRSVIKSWYFGRNFIYRTTLSSTNILSKRLVLSDYPLPMVIFAEEQTHGKGRLMRSWFSPLNKGIWMTVVFPPADKSQVFGQYNFIMSLVIASAVETVTSLKVSFKWPNDILVSDKKFCGILSETLTGCYAKPIVMTGAGLNVSIDKDSFPEELRDKATSLSIESGAPVNRQELFIEIVHSLNIIYAIWERRGIEPLYHEWLQKCSTTGKNVAISTEKQYINGKAEKINTDGSLVLRDTKGKLHTIFAGDLEYIIQ